MGAGCLRSIGTGENGSNPMRLTLLLAGLFHPSTSESWSLSPRLRGGVVIWRVKTFFSDTQFKQLRTGLTFHIKRS